MEGEGGRRGGKRMEGKEKYRKGETERQTRDSVNLRDTTAK